MTVVVDYHGRPINRSTSGRWTAALFIIGVEIAERFAYYGVSSNLITYLTGTLHQSTASAAASVNAWTGVASMLPLLGAFLADFCLGRYRMIVISSAVFLLGLGLLTLSSMLMNLHPHIHIAFFYAPLYLVAIADGGLKPCIQSFGSDQFDENDQEESIARSSFFNWWFFGMNTGIIASFLILSYVQDNVSWGLGFGIPCILLGISLVVFLIGTKTYRYYHSQNENPFSGICRAFAALKRSLGVPSICSKQSGPDFQENEHDVTNYAPTLEAKEVLRLFPIWASCLIFATVLAQSPTLFTKQGSTLDTRIGSSFHVPPASLQCFTALSIIAFIPIYDRILVPVARKFSELPSGITVLQRIGIGIFVSMVAMSVAALVETRRLKTARNVGMINSQEEAIPMTLWWLVPQYVLFGIAYVFGTVGLQEFFYDQVPGGLRSLGLALYLSIFGIGSFISVLLVSIIEKTTGKSRGGSWLSDNLNRAHLDYFYWLLAGLSALGLLVYIFLAHAYVYKKKQNVPV